MAEIESYANGRYKIVQKLGEGGMAEVFLALDTYRDIPVALKRPLESSLATDPKSRRFMQEVGIHGRVIHPNVVVMLDARIEVLSDGARIPFMVMEYAPGITAHDCCGDPREGGFGPLSPGIAGRIMLPVVGALRAMHDQGVYHRDIKPANVMVGWGAVGHRSAGWDPRAVKLMDFGIARDSDEDNSFTRAGTHLGTFFFMAPEQKRDAKSVDHRADIYSVGVTLWSMITGGSPPDLFISEIESAEFLVIPEPWRTIVFGATRYAPGKRAYQTAEELGAAIESALRESTERLGPFEHWLAQKKITSPVEAALRRARGVGLTIVAETDESGAAHGSGHTMWFQEGLISEKMAEPAVVPPPTAVAEEPPAEDIAAPLPKSRVRYAAAAAGFAAMAALVAFAVTSSNGTKEVVPDVPAVAVAAPVAEPVVTVVAPEVVPVVDVPSTKVEKTKRPVSTTTPDPSSLRGGETSSTIAAVPSTIPAIVPVAAPEPERGSVHLISGATSILLVGSDGTPHSPGRVAPGTYSIRATFPTKGEVANAGTFTLYPNEDKSVTCVEAMALCKAR